MYKRKLSDVMIFWALFTLLHRNVEAGPMKRLSRMVREVYPEIEPESEGNQAQVCIVGDVVYGTDEPVPADQPCLKCRCLPPGVQCETIQCVKKPGCKAIHKPNKCCPDYQCECEHNGRFYANGEKLETPPGGECKVCYCRGGEVQCAEVSCYIRKDCEGKRVPGKCCPKYDHCPPIDPVSDGRSPYTTEITISNLDKESYEPWPITGLSQNVTENTLNPTSNDIQDENKIPDTNYYEPTTVSYKATEVDDLQKAGIPPRITIQEIIPERKEIPITAPPRVEIESQGTLIIEEAEEFLNHSNDLVVTDSDADSSEISEVFQHPPPVLRIGDKLLFLKKGEFVHEKDTSTPNSVITIIGAEGLQRGFEDSGEIHEVKIDNIPRDINASNNSNTIPEEKVDVSSSLDNTDPYLEPGNNDNLDRNDQSNSNKDVNISELNTAASTHILSLVKRKNKPASTTTEPSSAGTSTTDSPIISSTTEVNVLQETSTTGSTTVQESINETFVSSTTEVIDLAITTTVDVLDVLTTEQVKNVTENILLHAENNTETKEVNPVQSSTKIYEVVSEQNPAYPPIPDIMSSNNDDTSQRFDIDNTEKDHVAENTTTLPTFKILPEVLEIRSNKTVPQNATNSEWLKTNPDTLINIKATLPDELLNQPAPTDVEDSTDIANDTNITVPDTSTETLVTTTELDTLTTLGTENDKKLDIVLVSTISTTKLKNSERSVETMENTSEDSGESTTPKDSHASIIVNENASIEYLNKGSTEVDDMVSARDAVHDNSGEQTTPSTPNGSGRIDKEWKDSPKKSNSSGSNNKDVEIIDTTTLQKKTPVIERSIETTTIAELLPKPEKILQLPAKIIGKRENSPDDEAEEVYKELENELNAETTERLLTNEEEEKEADVIFKELLEDTSTPKTKKDSVEPRNKEAETLQRVTDALAQFALRGKQPDSGILGVLSNFFSSQYQQYSKK